MPGLDSGQQAEVRAHHVVQADGADRAGDRRLQEVRRAGPRDVRHRRPVREPEPQPGGHRAGRVRKEGQSAELHKHYQERIYLLKFSCVCCFSYS